MWYHIDVKGITHQPSIIKFQKGENNMCKKCKKSNGFWKLLIICGLIAGAVYAVVTILNKMKKREVIDGAEEDLEGCDGCCDECELCDGIEEEADEEVEAVESASEE